MSGTVVATGEQVEAEWMGRNVCALVNGGGYAEYCVATAALCLKVPDDMDLIEAAAIPETLFTVWSNLFGPSGLSKGDSLLLHGGTSGIGTMTISLCKWADVATLVTVGSEQKHQIARERFRR